MIPLGTVVTRCSQVWEPKSPTKGNVKKKKSLLQTSRVLPYGSHIRKMGRSVAFTLC